MTTHPLAARETSPRPSLLSGLGFFRRNLAARLGAMVLGTMLLALSAHIAVPFWPVPMSLQTLVVLLIGLAYGANLAGATLLLYLAEGAIGFPVFHGGAGLAYFAGPTAGYLIGFVPAAILVGIFAERGAARGLARTAAILLAGDALIFATGLAWLAVNVGPAKSLAFGLLPFLPAEAVKLALAAAMAPVLRGTAFSSRR